MAKSRARKFADLLDSSGNIKSDRTNAAKTLSDLQVSATKEELNLLDGVTATTAELNYVDGVTSNIQTQIDNITQATGNELENVSEDTTPQLGGNLDVGGNSIVSSSNGDINITPNGTGSVVIDGLSHPQSDGTADQLLKTDGAGNLSFTDAPSSDLVDDTTPQLGGTLDTNSNPIKDAAGVDLQYNGTTKLSTTSGGVEVTGHTYASGGVYPTNAASQTANTAVWWKLGTLSNFSNSKSAEIIVYGTNSYSAGSDIAGKTTLLLRGSNASTTTEAFIYSETMGNAGLTQAAWKNTAANEFEIYVKTGTYQALELTVTTSGTWTNDLTTTGSATQPASTTTFDQKYNLQIGGTTKLSASTTGITLGDTGNGTFKPVSGTYGSIEIDGGAHSGWEGYSIGGRIVFMHNNSDHSGIYNDVNNHWLFYGINGGSTYLYHNGSAKIQTTSYGMALSGNPWCWAEGSNNLRVDLRQGSAKNWAAVNQQSSGHPIYDSYNTSSSVDMAVGDTKININNDMNNSNHIVVAQDNLESGTGNMPKAHAWATGAYQVRVTDHFQDDRARLAMTCHGDLA